jgi:hypothetical protein
MNKLSNRDHVFQRLHFRAETKEARSLLAVCFSSQESFSINIPRIFLHKHEFSFLNRILVVPGGRLSILSVSSRTTLLLDEQIQNRGRHRRSDMKKFLTIVGLLTIIATPAFAQSYSHDFGTGNIVDTPALEQQAGRVDANSAFAQAPEVSTSRKARVQGGVDSYSPAETGGGSEGYNWALAHNY